MAKKIAHQPGTPRRTTDQEPEQADELPDIRARILKKVSQVRILDPAQARDFIHRRQQSDIDKYDEVWDGVYVVPPLANNPHQSLVGFLTAILHEIVVMPGRGLVLPGANVSDRRTGWEHNYRDPDLVVVLNDGRAVDCTTHWMGGPDFLVEIRSPGDETDEKIPFYSRIQVRELLIIHRDTRELQLLRHDGQELRSVEPTLSRGKNWHWLVSEVVPLAFRLVSQRGVPRTQVRRTDTKRGTWMV
jgi:Uma2 family endonuclease